LAENLSRQHPSTKTKRSLVMINTFLRLKTKNINNTAFKVGDIQQADKILFSLFTRYGDTIIDLVVIKEFMEQYPDKEYLVLCPRQMKPYVSELLSDVECISLNKRHLFDMLKINQKLKKWQPDIGFNPWSNGLDSCYFLTYCKKFLCYKDFIRPNIINHYQVVRRYLQLPEKVWKINELDLKKEYQKILICPQSTDENRSISTQHLSQIIADLNKNYNNLSVTIAAINSSYFRPDCSHFLFHKTKQSSQAFIDLVKGSELVICADSAPLHFSLALNKHVKVVFSTTNPEVVLNSGVNILHA
jgi:ADP-heptose:LPS heptosyltransferase